MATSGQLVPDSVQVPDNGKVHIPAEEKMYRNLATIHASCILMFIP